MRNIDWIVIHSGVLMAVLTDARCHADPNAQMLSVTVDASLYTQYLASLSEFGFQKFGHGMSVVWICVAGQTLIVACWRVDEMTVRICQSNGVHQVAECLAGIIPRGRDMTFTALCFAVTGVAWTGGVPGLAPGKQK